MARPTTGKKGAATNLYLCASVKTAATELAKSRGYSLSDLVARLLVAEMSRKRGIAHRHARTL